MGCLYILTSPSGKNYIGISKHDVEARWRGHVKDARRRKDGLYGAIRKYGAERFSRRVLVIASDEAYLNHLERGAIRSFGTRSPKGYNLVDGGEGTLNPCDSTRAAMKAAAVARFSNESERIAASERTRKAWTPEREASLKQRTAQYWERPNVKAKAAERMGEIRLRPEVKAKVSAAHRKNWADPEFRARMSEIRKRSWARRKQEQHVQEES